MFSVRCRPRRPLARMRCRSSRNPTSSLKKLRIPFDRLELNGMPLTVDPGSCMADRLRAAILIRKQIDQLERRFAWAVANLPKHLLTRNNYGFGAGEMTKIARKLHAKAQTRDREPADHGVPRLDRRSFIASAWMRICEGNFARGSSSLRNPQLKSSFASSFNQLRKEVWPHGALRSQLSSDPSIRNYQLSAAVFRTFPAPPSSPSIPDG